MMSIRPDGVLEAALYVDDLDAAEAFYGGILQMDQITRVGKRHAFYRCGSTILLLFNAAETRKPTKNLNLPVPPHGASGAGHVCFSMTGDRLPELAAHLQTNGIAIEADFKWPNGARSIYFRDPSGNSVEYAEPRLWFPDG
jgi:catechol 2,3-dioxygenase-like lactoylglutathione lyase family enzyme